MYLDAAFMGYPVLHNAPMCKDVGYYYEGCDTVEASKKLNWIYKIKISYSRSKINNWLLMLDILSSEAVKAIKTNIHQNM